MRTLLLRSPFVGLVGLGVLALGVPAAHSQAVFEKEPSYCEVYGALSDAPSEECPDAGTDSGGGLTVEGATRGLSIASPSEDGNTTSDQTQEQQQPAQRAASFGTVQFEFDSARLTLSARRTLDTVAQVLKDEQLGSARFTVEGHTDAKGAAGYNRDLSQRRAQAVIDYLSDVQGVQRARLRGVGRGEARLLDPENPESGINRRVVIVNTGTS